MFFSEFIFKEKRNKNNQINFLLSDYSNKMKKGFYSTKYKKKLNSFRYYINIDHKPPLSAILTFFVLEFGNVPFCLTIL